MWLGMGGRSDEDLARMLKRPNAAQEMPVPNRQEELRHALKNAPGQLIHNVQKIPCVFQEIGVDGCSVLLEKPFRPGALAYIEVVLPLFGMVLHMSATTEILVEKRLIDIRFVHKNQRSRTQIAGLIACLTGESTPEAVQETIAAKQLNSSAGDVLAVVPPEVKPGSMTARKAYDPLVHGGEGRLQAQQDVEWPVILRAPDDRFTMVGAIVDLSMGGCTVRTLKPFIGEEKDGVEVGIDLQGLQVRVLGVAQAVYEPKVIGVRFNAMPQRRKDDLAQILEELTELANTPLEAA
jgi:hypothetical protein